MVENDNCLYSLPLDLLLGHACENYLIVNISKNVSVFRCGYSYNLVLFGAVLVSNVHSTEVILCEISTLK